MSVSSVHRSAAFNHQMVTPSCQNVCAAQVPHLLVNTGTADAADILTRYPRGKWIWGCENEQIPMLEAGIDEELKLFCETDKKLICVVCAAAREHKSHSFMLIEEAVEIYKDQVKSSFESLTENKSEIEYMEQRQEESISGVQEESHKLQSQITSQFAELHQILAEKEQRLLGEIREEEKKIVQTMEKNLQKIQENLKSIQEELSKLQEQIDHKDGGSWSQDEVGHAFD
ncbi:E3 ubiquitin-protein ligase TRIM17-like [Rhinoraja longicauda]